MKNCSVLSRVFSWRSVLSAIVAVSLSGCIAFKDDRAVKTVVVKSEVVGHSVEILADRGVTAKLTPDRGQMLMELFWWNKRKTTITQDLHKQDAVLKTECVGFFPGAKSNDSIVGFTLGSLIVNSFTFCIPTVLSSLYGPMMDPVDVHNGEPSLSEFGIFGNFSYLDRKNPEILREYVEKKAEEKIEENPIRLTDFEVEIGGNVFRGENGIAYVGTVVGSKSELEVKLLSFIPPAGFASNAVSSVCGSGFLVKVPTAADIMAETEKNRLQELEIARQKQAERDAAEASAAAQRELAMALANAAVQGVNAGMAARTGGTRVPAVSTVPMPASRGSSTSIPRTCPACYGTGRCRPCDGSGKNPAKQYTAGRLYDSRVPSKCGPCSGTGNCLTCKGKGSL